MLRATNTEIQLNNIAHNISVIKALQKPGTKYLAVVKANAYGHGIEEVARFVQKHGADYLGVGAVFPTGSKDDADDVSYETLKAICGAVSIPVVAIGGITQENVAKLAGSGICGVAVISAIYAAKNIQQASADLKAATEKMLHD